MATRCRSSIEEVFARLTTIIRQLHVRNGSGKAVSVGQLITSTFWPVIRQCLAQHPADSKLATWRRPRITSRKLI